MKKDFDWLIVGAGFTGATLAERIATQLDKKVLVIDKRNHIGGNAYDYHNEYGVLVHKYGPHIFHTNSKKVWDYLSGFTSWRPYYHRVLGVIDGNKIPLPFNLNSLYALYSPHRAKQIEEAIYTEYKFGDRIPVLKLRENKNTVLARFAEDVYNKVFLNYTTKQWGMRPEDLAPSVTARVPILVSRDDRYFQDCYQAMPRDGYTVMFERILRHRNIKVMLNTSYAEVADYVGFRDTIFTGSIDELLDYRFGELPYRSLRFEMETVAEAQRQEVGTVNYPNEHDFTRITEQKHLTGQDSRWTTLVYEYPGAYRRGENEPYYPIPTGDNRELYKKYAAGLSDLEGRVIVAGRLGEYQYYNMDQAVAAALKIFETEVAKQ